MKSAYGVSKPSEDIDLSHVGPGTPMGELMRAFWQPVAVAEELGDLPSEVRILGEDLIVFRTKAGAFGCLEPHCAHRGTSLVYGRIEEHGIRCCYHGWLYDVDGTCMEMPCEAPDYPDQLAVRQPGYPTLVYGGLVFVYMGDPEIQPLFPMYDIIDTRYRDDVVLRGMRLWDDSSIGFVRDCNWLQHFENVVGPWHLVVLHQQVGLGLVHEPRQATDGVRQHQVHGLTQNLIHEHVDVLETGLVHFVHCPSVQTQRVHAGDENRAFEIVGLVDRLHQRPGLAEVCSCPGDE